MRGRPVTSDDQDLIISLYLSGDTCDEVGEKMGLCRKAVGRTLAANGIKRRAHRRANSAHEYSKDGPHVGNGRDHSKCPRMDWETQDKVFGSRLFDDHPNPMAGQLVWIHARQVYSQHGSMTGCAAALCTR